MSDKTLYEFTAPGGRTLKAYGRDGTNDQNTLISCLAEDEYQVGQIAFKSGSVIDIGSHIGGVTLALAAKGYLVYACEMLPENNALARENLALNNLEHRVRFIERAIVGKGNKDVPAFYADTSTESGDAHRFIGTILTRREASPQLKNGKSRKVPVMTLANLFKENHLESVDFMKIDVEGAEWDIIQNTPKEILNKVNRIAVEIESLDGNETSTQAFLMVLGDDFIDVSKEMFPKWSHPSKLVHGYYINKRLK